MQANRKKDDYKTIVRTHFSANVGFHEEVMATTDHLARKAGARGDTFLAYLLTMAHREAASTVARRAYMGEAAGIDA